MISQTDFFNLSSSPLARQIEVESSEVGYIIGKGGEQIRELQQMSLCRIDMLRDSNTLKIAGSRVCLNKAKALIMCKSWGES